MELHANSKRLTLARKRQSDLALLEPPLIGSAPAPVIEPPPKTKPSPKPTPKRAVPPPTPAPEPKRLPKFVPAEPGKAPRPGRTPDPCRKFPVCGHFPENGQ